MKHVVIKRNVGKWYVCLQIELPDVEPILTPKLAVGIDVGLHSLLAMSDGTLVDNPRWLRSQLKKLRVAQRRMSRRKRGGSGRRKAAHQVATIHEKIANQRNDFWHKLTTQLVNTYGTIAVENLNLSFMLRNGNLSLSAHDAALGRFFEMIDYKAEEAGGQIIRVNRHNTSQLCSGCGHIVAKGLSVRVHRCDCGVELDRDINAALNILYRAVGRTVEALTWSVATCVASEAPPL